MSDDRSIETGAVAVKAGLWYTICNFLFKGMAFLSTPIFSRLMSKEELGGFSNFSSWVSILFVVTSMDLSQSIIRSKLELEEDIGREMKRTGVIIQQVPNSDELLLDVPRLKREKVLFKDVMAVASFKPSSCRCPKCGAVGRFSQIHSYRRLMISVEHGRRSDAELIRQNPG